MAYQDINGIVHALSHSVYGDGYYTHCHWFRGRIAKHRYRDAAPTCLWCALMSL